MKKVIDFNSSKDHYTADACVVWCFDDRFYKLLKAFGKQEGFKNIDLVKIAGGAKALASAGADRDFVVSQIKVSIRLHGTKNIMLMLHRDCGAYGGSAAFADVEAERVNHEAQLAAARDFLAGEIPDAHIDAYFADWDGLYAI